ncbi:RluA family pseudouridine synthase [Acetivibrio cellulolyticus]|uniref:RluA family pseudouridine synthase n=1 Tax=Acetivibrio cellulolyticus TaxID=35830 RepID=UPI0001E2D44E|nr:RluA family pseudouridine synthase [Acetivibrio cellulolyticus]
MSPGKNMKIKILYEDNHLLVVEKPVNIPVQQDSTNDVDMLTLLKEDIKVRYNKPGNVYLGLVHRLDRPVGGAMVFAKTSKAASRLSDQVRTRGLNKTYYAVVHGKFEDKQGRLENYLLKDEKTNMVSVVSPEVAGAKQAILDYKVIDVFKDYTLIKVDLHTGRSHQIRVQFSNIGHPLYGDQRYGKSVNKVGQQIALWSCGIALKHPTTEEELDFKCNPPDVEPWNWFKYLGF